MLRVHTHEERFDPPYKLNMGMEMSFWHTLLRKSDAYEEHGDVFFWYAPGPDLACKDFILRY
jgi:hypothetical protein